MLNNVDMGNNKMKPNILLLGNGINRAFGESSWEDVINGLSTGEFDCAQKWMKEINKLPFGLQTVVISSDSVSDGMCRLSKKLMPHKLKDDHALLLRSLASLPFDAVLTTNYSYEIETALQPDFIVKSGCSSKYRKKTMDGNKSQEQFGLFRYYDVAGRNIWHIHGEAAHPSSMVMGHYYYGKILSEIQKRIPNLIREYKIACKNGKQFIPRSWVDYFMIGNVHVLGFGMDPSEMDIWWLVNCKKRNFPGKGRIFFYEPNLERENRFAVKALCETFDIWYDDARANGKKQYVLYYNDVVNRLGTVIFGL